MRLRPCCAPLHPGGMCCLALQRLARRVTGLVNLRTSRICTLQAQLTALCILDPRGSKLLGACCCPAHITVSQVVCSADYVKYDNCAVPSQCKDAVHERYAAMRRAPSTHPAVEQLALTRHAKSCAWLVLSFAGAAGTGAQRFVKATALPERAFAVQRCAERHGATHGAVDV